MPEIDIRRLDFTLLAVLVSLLRTRKSTDTAAELNMTQSTVSHALARLREMIGDPLFVRRPHGLEPTPHALRLAPVLEGLFALGRDLLSAPRFEPRSAGGVLRIGAADYHCALMAAPLIQRLGERAPKVRVSFRPLIRKPAIEALLAGEIDIAVGRFFRLPASVVEQQLFIENYGVVARRRHPLFRGTMDLDGFAAARHIVVSLDGALDGVVDRALAEQGRERDVVAAVPYFLAALAAAAAGDVLVTLPLRLAEAYAGRFGLIVRTPPLELPSFAVSAVIPAAAAGPGLADWVVREILPEVVEAGSGDG